MKLDKEEVKEMPERTGSKKPHKSDLTPSGHGRATEAHDQSSLRISMPQMSDLATCNIKAWKPFHDTRKASLRGMRRSPIKPSSIM